ncbi:MAG: hypothetical protein KDA86_15970 [Planctomycetaceae bacterium]|nr:hypothetical protein [Planctomycetaceae bacterium]
MMRIPAKNEPTLLPADFPLPGPDADDAVSSHSFAHSLFAGPLRFLLGGWIRLLAIFFLFGVGGWLLRERVADALPADFREWLLNSLFHF